MKFGAHMSTSGGLWKALERGVQAGCDVVQIFVKNNMQWSGRPLQPIEQARFAQAREQSKFAAVFAHAGYLINLAAPPGPNRDKSIQSLIQEVELASALDLPFLVLHPGAHLGQGERKGLHQVVRGLNEVIRATPQSKLRIALENTAGQGTCLGYRTAHLADIIGRVERPSRLGLCLDTAHFFAAGHDLRTPEGWSQAIAEVDRTVGLDQILAFHLNDSKTDLGSRVDRHAHIGQGKIGRAAFRHVVRDLRFKDLPGCLETPKSPDLHEDMANLRVLRALETARRAPAKRKKRLHRGP